MADWQIAQMNVATALYPLDDPRMSEFMSRLDSINELAEASAGFVWRLQSDSGNATDIQVDENPRFIVNMSVWRDVESLFDFAYKSGHRTVMAKRRQWFERPDNAYQVLWWVEAGHAPTVEEGLARLSHLQANGPSAFAFTFKAKFPAPGTTGDPRDLGPEPYCVGWS
ncbi:MAG: DUF3291 domain-containing protein [Pseudomonadota bacterium]